MMPSEALNGTSCNLLDEFKHPVVMVSVLTGPASPSLSSVGSACIEHKGQDGSPSAISIALLNS